MKNYAFLLLCFKMGGGRRGGVHNVCIEQYTVVCGMAVFLGAAAGKQGAGKGTGGN